MTGAFFCVRKGENNLKLVIAAKPWVNRRARIKNNEFCAQYLYGVVLLFVVYIITSCIPIS